MKEQVEKMDAYGISIGEYLKAIQQTAYSLKEFDDRSLTIINNAISSIKFNLMIIKGVTEGLDI